MNLLQMLTGYKVPTTLLSPLGNLNTVENRKPTLPPKQKPAPMVPLPETLLAALEAATRNEQSKTKASTRPSRGPVGWYAKQKRDNKLEEYRAALGEEITAGDIMRYQKCSQGSASSVITRWVSGGHLKDSGKRREDGSAGGRQEKSLLLDQTTESRLIQRSL